jgi:hypothetical protein
LRQLEINNIVHLKIAYWFNKVVVFVSQFTGIVMPVALIAAFILNWSGLSTVLECWIFFEVGND